MPLEVATSIKGLVPTNPAGSDPIAGSDDHIRLIKDVLTKCFPQVDGAVVANHFQLGGFVPSGGIIAWSGTVAQIPDGWHLCDGTNGTPNLHAKFLFGTTIETEVGEVGGALVGTTSENGNHNHAMTNAGAHSHGGGTAGHALTISQMPSHNHTGIIGTTLQEGSGYFDAFDGGTGVSGQNNSGFSGGSQAHNHGIGSDGNHSHGIFTGGAHQHTVPTVPPYYRLAFIMRAYPPA